MLCQWNAVDVCNFVIVFSAFCPILINNINRTLGASERSFDSGNLKAFQDKVIAKERIPFHTKASQVRRLHHMDP